MTSHTLKRRGLLLVLSSPSGAGKTTLARRLLEAEPHSLRMSVSVTTRKPSPDEVDGRDYTFLVLGRSPQGGGSGGEAALQQKAAGAMGLGGGALTQSLGDVLGLNSLQMGSSGDSNGDTALMLGKYLSPNLYVGYGVGLFNAVSTFNVRYRVSKRLSFESSSSALGFGADLIYTLER